MHASPTYEIHALNAWTAGRFRGLTSAAQRRALGSAHPDGAVVVFGATAGEDVVGLAMASVMSHGALAGAFAVDRVYVHPSYRGRGIGSALLGTLETRLRDRRVPSLVAHADPDWLTPPRQEWLARHGWSAVIRRLRHVTCAMTLGQEPWVTCARVPRPFELFRWGGLAPERRREVERPLRGAAWIPDAVAPWHVEDLEPANSLGVSRDGETVGWVLTQRASPDTVCYAAVCVRPDVRRRGLGVLLLAEAVRRQVQALGIGSSGVFCVRPDNAPMLRLIERRLKRHVTASVEVVVARKTLTAAPIRSQFEANTGAEVSASPTIG